MSGLGAIFQTDGAPVPPAALSRMENALKLYGQKRQQSRIFDGIGLCWTHLNDFVPEDAYDSQPVIAGALSLLFSGYLTERNELASKLNIDPSQLKIMPDSKLILKAWQKWGSKTPHHVHGRLAVILADSKSQTVFAFRSPMNAAPLLYHEQASRIVIATAPKAIFALGDIPRELNEARIADSLILNYEDVEHSYYKNIKRVPLGCMLEFGREGKKFHRYHELTAVPEVRFKSDDEYVEAAQELLNRSVNCAMRSTKTPAAMLSSGYDSSTVVVTLLELLGWDGENATQQLQTYTHVPEPGWDGNVYGQHAIGDETDGVKALAEKYPAIATNFIASEGVSLERDLDTVFLMAEIPPRNLTNLYWAMDIRKRAASDGNHVLLGGQSGNATLSFDGRPLYARLFRQGKWLKLFRELYAIEKRGGSFRGIYSRAVAPNIPAPLSKGIARLRRQITKTGWAGYSAIRPAFAQRMRVSERAFEMDWKDGFQGFSDSREAMRKMLSRGTRDEGQQLQYALEAMTGVQTRDPLGDRRLIEFCAGLPEEQFIKNGKSRRLLRRMMNGKLPDQILDAPKGRQAADWHLRMTRDLPRYRAEIEALGQNPLMAERFDLARLQKILDSWPEKTPVSHGDHPDYAIAMIGLSRALATARYINWVEGNNR